MKWKIKEKEKSKYLAVMAKIKAGKFDRKNKEKLPKVQFTKTNNLTIQKFLVWRRQKGFCSSGKTFLDPDQSDSLDLHHVLKKNGGESDKVVN